MPLITHLPRAFVGCAAFIALLLTNSGQSAEPKAMPLWPGRAPNETAELPAEADRTKPTDELIAGKRVIRLGNVSAPTLTVYPADPAKATGAAVVVCPGGGYYILAMDLEGTEVCDWLNSIGVTAVLLKYRVPARAGQPRYAAPLQDAQRAVGIVRSRAKELGIDAQRIGVLGFSAGGHLAALLSTSADQRTYTPVDDNDTQSCRPNFAVLIYPGGLVPTDGSDALSPEFKLTSGQVPPTFITITEDDGAGAEATAVYYRALKQAHASAELHIYPRGGHGYGLRRNANLVTRWPERVAEWLKAEHFISAP